MISGESFRYYFVNSHPSYLFTLGINLYKNDNTFQKNKGEKKVRGCQKKIVYFKNTGSKLFDEAYFVISDKTDKNKAVSDDMIAEANRIIDECSQVEREVRGKTYFGNKRIIKRGLLFFSFGALVSAVISTVILIILI